MISDTKKPPRVAYLTGEYPAISHTFILREVEALRAIGRDVLTCSIRRTGLAHHRGPAEKHAATTTFYVLSAARNPWRLARAQWAGMQSLKRYFSTLGLAWSTRQPGLRGTLYQLFYFFEATVLALHLKENNVSHLHNHFGNSSCSVAMLASALSGIPFSYTMHGPAIFFEPRLWRIDEKIARAHFVACISQFCRSQGMIFAHPTHWEKLQIVHCGITPELYGDRKDKPAGKRILFVGRLAAVKGVPILLEAFAQILESHPDAELTLVGDGIEKARIKAHAAQLGCAGSVHFTGYLSQSEVAEELKAADIFALPSFAEGVPVVLMEAMASRLPVVATQIAGISELVISGETGLIVPPSSIDAFAEALVRLLDDPDLRRTMGDKGRHKVETEFNIATEVARLNSFFPQTKG